MVGTFTIILAFTISGTFSIALLLSGIGLLRIGKQTKDKFDKISHYAFGTAWILALTPMPIIGAIAFLQEIGVQI